MSMGGIASGLTMIHTMQERRGAVMLFLPHEKGQGLVEYALVLVQAAIVVIAILLLGPIIGWVVFLLCVVRNRDKCQQFLDRPDVVRGASRHRGRHRGRPV